MIIVSSNIALASSLISSKTTSTSEHLRKWDATSDITSDTYKANGVVKESSLRIKDVISAKGKIPGPALLTAVVPSRTSTGSDVNDGITEELFGTVKERIMKDMVEMITGKKIRLLDPSSIRDAGSGADAPAAQGASDAQNSGQRDGTKLQGWGVDYSYQETTSTKEGVAVSASGTVTTADGRAIDFTASLEMSRETTEQTTVSVKAGDALIDPLMIDTTGNGVQLSGAKFTFDLNSDGSSEQISAPSAGCGFLAYDRNGNGIVDNGSELFGPRTGQGFTELSQLDSDKNGWIDENDAAFNKLSVWQKNADGTDSMLSLKDSGIGALYLGQAASRFDLTDANNPTSNSVAGVLRDTGLFLRETGQTGFMQEVDLKA